MKAEALDKLQNVFIALFIGLTIPPAIGFGFDFWVTKASAERKSNEAVLTVQTAICVAQFTNAPNNQQLLKEYKTVNYAARSAFFEKGGWSKMPGEEKAQDAVTQACASKLDALAQK